MAARGREQGESRPGAGAQPGRGRGRGRGAARTAVAIAAGLALAAASCGGAKPPAPAAVKAKEPSPAGADHAADMTAVSPAPEPKAYAVRMEEGDAAEALGPDAGKLTQIGKLSPKTHAALLKSYLWKPIAECEGIAVVAVDPAPGLLVAEGQAPKVRAEVYTRLKEAGAMAKQRGTSIEVLSGHEAVSEAVKRWNQAALEAALAEAKTASRADRKAKNLMSAARKHLDAGGDPKSWTLWGADACASGPLSGLSVTVQLVATDAGGGRGAVLVKGGAEGDRFEKDTYEATYWDKAKGKNFRTLTEIMSAGRFVRQCSEASRFIATQGEGTWRCKEGTESWEPPNRPISAWQ